MKELVIAVQSYEFLILLNESVVRNFVDEVNEKRSFYLFALNC